MNTKDIVGIALSVLATIWFLWLLLDSMHVGHPVRHRLGGSRLARRIWPGLLVVSFVAGLYGLPLGRAPEDGRAESASGGDSTPYLDGEEVSEAVARSPVDSRRSTVRTPFYLFTRYEKRVPGAEWSETGRRAALQLPWLFLLTALAYLFARRRSRRKPVGGRAT